MKHLLSLASMNRGDMENILAAVPRFKQHRSRRPGSLAASRPPAGMDCLTGQTWGLIFSKSSTRTRVSFEVGIRELGGDALFLNANDIQLGRGEPIKDTARVLGRMIHGAVIRTYAQLDVEEFASYSGIPTINALTDDEHPCQILTDIFTYQESRGSIRGRTVTFIGDAACNVPISWIWAASKLGFHLRLAAPKAYQPPAELLAKAGGSVVCTEDVRAAAEGSDLLYTDVFVSMGKEAESARRLQDLAEYQINAGLVALAAKDALVMHCLPAYRGKEIDEATFESHADTIFRQAENRLHTQKAVLHWLVSESGA